MRTRHWPHLRRGNRYIDNAFGLQVLPLLARIPSPHVNLEALTNDEQAGRRSLVFDLPGLGSGYNEVDVAAFARNVEAREGTT